MRKTITTALIAAAAIVSMTACSSQSEPNAENTDDDHATSTEVEPTKPAPKPKADKPEVVKYFCPGGDGMVAVTGTATRKGDNTWVLKDDNEDSLAMPFDGDLDDTLATLNCERA